MYLKPSYLCPSSPWLAREALIPAYPGRLSKYLNCVGDRKQKFRFTAVYQFLVSQNLQIRRVVVAFCFVCHGEAKKPLGVGVL